MARTAPTVEVKVQTYEWRAAVLNFAGRVLPGFVVRWLYRAGLWRVRVARYRIGTGPWEDVTIGKLMARRHEGET